MFLIRRPPYGGLQARESLDQVLTAAAFDQQVAVLFLDDGVMQLRAGQAPPVSGPRSLAPIFGLLEVYGIVEVWAERESLDEREMSVDGLVISVKALPRSAVPGLIAGFDLVISC